MPTWVWIASGVGLALVAAFLAIGWIAERRERATYIKTLDQPARQRLAAWESVDSNWRTFRDSETIDRKMAADAAARLKTFATEYKSGRA